jgi:hypothetical protein
MIPHSHLSREDTANRGGSGQAASTVELQVVTITNLRDPGVPSMRKVFSFNDVPWQNLRGDGRAFAVD